MKNLIFSFLTTVFVLGLLISSFPLYQYDAKQNESEVFYEELKEETVLIQNQAADSDNEEYTISTQKEIDFEALRRINSDIVGWLYCDNTAIDYPALKGTDNNFYLDKRFDKAYDVNGSFFLDFRNTPDFSDTKSIIYGHHMLNGTMFSSLLQYKKQEYYEEHPYLTLVTPEHKFIIHLFAGYVASVDEDIWDLSDTDSESNQRLINKVISNSTFIASNNPNLSDRIIVLSTCSYEFDNARFVVFGCLLNQPE